MTAAGAGWLAGMPALAADIRERLAAVRGTQVAGAAVALAAALLAGRGALGTGVTLRALAAGATLAAVVHAFGSERAVVRSLAAVLLVPAGGLVAASLGPVGRALEVGLATALGAFAAVAAVGTVGFCTALAGSRAPGGGRVKRAVNGGLGALLGPFVLLLAVTLPDAGATRALLGLGGWLGGGLLDHALGSDPGLGFLVFPGLVAVVAVALKGTLATLPVEALAPDARRAAVGESLGRVDRLLSVVAAVGGIGVVILLFVALLAGAGSTSEVARLFGPLAPALHGLLTTPLLRVPLVGLLVGAVLVRVGYWLARRARRTSLERAVERTAPPAAAAALVAVLAWRLVDRGVVADLAAPVGLDGLAAAAPYPTAVVVLLLAGLLAVWALLDVVALGGLLPARAVGPAMAGVATFGLALLAVLLGSLVVGFLLAGLALVTWEAGAYGSGLRTELEGKSTRAELVHLGGVAGVALGAVVVAVALAALLGGALVAATPGTLAALLLATVGAFLLVAAV